VAPQEKADARAAVVRVLDGFPKDGRLVYVRPNDLDSGLLEDDLAAVVRPGLDGIHLPKVHRPATLVHVDHYLTLLERLSGLPCGSVRMMAWIESAEGVANVEAICAASPRLVAVSVGSEDYAASLGVGRSADGAELAFARARVVNAAAASGLVAIDGRNPSWGTGTASGRPPGPPASSATGASSASIPIRSGWSTTPSRHRGRSGPGPRGSSRPSKPPAVRASAPSRSTDPWSTSRSTSGPASCCNGATACPRHRPERTGTEARSSSPGTGYGAAYATGGRIGAAPKSGCWITAFVTGGRNGRGQFQ